MPEENNKFTPQFASPLAEQIEQFLINAIMQGKYKPGQRLVENELLREFGVSRSPIREAFMSLVKSGLLVNVPRSGTYVKDITEKDIRDKFPVRAYLEGFAAGLAAQQIGPGDIDQLGSALSKMKESAERDDFRSYTDSHNAFHMVFINASKNDTLIHIIKTLRQDILWLRFSYLWHVENYQNALPVHQEILKFFIERQAEAVENLVRTHIVRNMESYIIFLSSITTLERSLQ
jgi:DNA-binding GntR family transcriptional regulator